MNTTNTPGFTLTSISAADAKRLEKYQHDCGCGMGAAFFIASIVLYLSYLLLMPGATGIGIVHGTVIGVITAFASSLSGKLLGVGIARIRLTLLIRSLQTKRHTQGG